MCNCQMVSITFILASCGSSLHTWSHTSCQVCSLILRLQDKQLSNVEKKLASVASQRNFITSRQCKNNCLWLSNVHSSQLLFLGDSTALSETITTEFMTEPMLTTDTALHLLFHCGFCWISVVTKYETNLNIKCHLAYFSGTGVLHHPCILSDDWSISTSY